MTRTVKSDAAMGFNEMTVTTVVPQLHCLIPNTIFKYTQAASLPHQTSMEISPPIYQLHKSLNVHIGGEMVQGTHMQN